MKEVLQVGAISAEPGQKKYGPATWVELRDGTRVHLPVILINGAHEGPKVVINACTHPTELVGFASVQVLTRKIDPSTLKGGLVVFPISNPSGDAVR